MTRPRLLIASVLASILLVAIFAAAQPAAPQELPPGPRGVFGPGLFRDLDLTEQQRADIRKLVADQRESGRPVMTRVAEVQQELRNEVFADAPNLGRIEELKSQIAMAQQEALAARIDLELKLAQILTPEQRQQVREAGPRQGFGPRRRGMRPGAGGPGALGRRPDGTVRQ